MEQNGVKRRLISRESHDYSTSNVNHRLLLVDSATNTECLKPMQLNAWTQTASDDFISKSNLPLIDELQNRINKLEDLFRSYSLNSNNNEPLTITPAPPIISTKIVNDVENIIATETIKQASFRPTQQTKYKIITSKGVEYIEPIEVVYAEEDGIYNMDHDLNNSNDSQRLEICLPKDDEDQEQHQEQHQQQQNVQQNQQQILYQTQIETQQVHEQTDQKYYNHPAIHNTLVSTAALQTPNLSPVQQPTQSSSQSPPLTIDIEQAIKKEPTTKKTNLGSVTNLNEITSSQQQEPRIVHDITNVVVSLGPKNTRIPAHVYESMDWSSPTAATRKLLITIFERETLATHTMTGKPSPAFRGRDMPIKHQLDPDVVSDIIFVVSRKCGVPEKDVRNAITTKCADENKMSKQREKKRRTLAEYNKENVKNITKN